MTVIAPTMRPVAPRRAASGAPRARARWVRRCLVHGGALVLFTLLTLTRALPITLHPATTVGPDLIDPVFGAWDVASTLHSVTTWADGPWSFFDANIYFPTPHAAAYTDAAIGVLPFSLALGLLIHNPVALMNVLIALAFILSAYGAFLLAYRLTGEYAPALVAGLCFGFGPYRSEHFDHLNLVSTEWLIGAAYALISAWQTGSRRWWAVAGVLCGLSAVTSLYYLAYLTPPLLLVALLLCPEWTRTRIKGALLAAGIAAAITLPFMLPYATRHAEIPPQYGSATGTDLLSFVQVLPGRPLDSGLLPTVPFQPTQPYHGFFPGFAPLALALIAWRLGLARRWAIFAVACTVLALGPYLNVAGHTLPVPLPYGWLATLVPGFDLFRDPTRALIGASLGLALLSAWGARHVIHAAQMGYRRRLVAPILVGLCALELWSPLPTETLPALPAGEQWLAHQPRIHVVLELPIANRTPIDWQRQSEIMYDSTVHWKVLVNGASSLDPVGMARRRAILGTYPAPAALALLRRLRVDAVVLRLTWLSSAQRAAAQSACRVAYHDRLEEICVGPWITRIGHGP